MNFVKLSHRLSLLIAGIGMVLNGQAQSFLTNGLVAYYPFNGNANDASGNGDNGTVIGATLSADRFGTLRSAYSFDYTDLDAIQSSGLAIPRGVVSSTFSLWFRQSSRIWNDYLHAPLLSLWGVGSPTDFVAEFWASSLQVGFGSIGYKGYDGPNQPMLDGNWHQLVLAVFTNKCVAYIDSKPVVWNAGMPAPGSQHVLPTGNFYIGFAPYSYYDGWLDEIRVYNRAFSSNEVAQLYAYESTPPPLPKVALLKAVKPALTDLVIGTNYQLQLSADMNTWTNSGSVFTATNSSMIYPQYWDVDNWGKLFFRLQVAP